MKNILFLLLLFPLFLCGQIVNTKPIVGAVNNGKTITFTHNDSTKSIIKKVNVVTMSTMSSNSAVMLLLNGAQNSQQYYGIRASQMLYPIVTRQGLIDTLTIWLNDDE